MEQQKSFDEFVFEYNYERPHEALNMKTLASLYHPSLRPYPARVPELEYHGDVIIRRVRHNGEMRRKGELVYVSQAHTGEPVALKQKGEHHWEIRFSSCILGVLDELTGKMWNSPIPPTMARFLPTNCASTSFFLTTPPLAFIVFRGASFLAPFCCWLLFAILSLKGGILARVSKTEWSFMHYLGVIKIVETKGQGR
jgi:hypothetical protein